MLGCAREKSANGSPRQFPFSKHDKIKCGTF